MLSSGKQEYNKKCLRGHKTVSAYDFPISYDREVELLVSVEIS